MAVGVARFDEDHQELFSHLCEIERALALRAFDDADRICRSLLALGAQHTAEEEAFLRSIGYPGVVAVLQAHQALQTECRRLEELINQNSEEAGPFVAALKGVLVSYLLRSDINFKSFVQELRDLGRLK